MSTTLDLNDQLLADAKALAARQRTTLTRLIEEGLQLRLRARPASATPVRVHLPGFQGRSGPVAGVNPLSNQALLQSPGDHASRHRPGGGVPRRSSTPRCGARMARSFTRPNRYGCCVHTDADGGCQHSAAGDQPESLSDAGASGGRGRLHRRAVGDAMRANGPAGPRVAEVAPIASCQESARQRHARRLVVISGRASRRAPGHL